MGKFYYHTTEDFNEGPCDSFEALEEEIEG